MEYVLSCDKVAFLAFLGQIGPLANAMAWQPNRTVLQRILKVQHILVCKT